MRMRRFAWFGLVIFLSGANLLVWSLLAWDQAHAQTIYPGVYWQSQSLGGLTKQQAKQVFDNAKNQLMSTPITLRVDQTVYRPSLADLGYSINTQAMTDEAYQFGREPNFLQRIEAILFAPKKLKNIEVSYTVDQTTLSSYLDAISSQLVHPFKDASLQLNNGTVTVVPGEPGETVDKTTSKATLLADIKPGQTVDIALPLTQQAPTLVDASQLAPAKAVVDKLIATPITMQAGDTKITWDASTLYSLVSFQTKDNQLTASIDQTKLKNQVAALAKKINVTAASKVVLSTDQSTINDGHDGRQLNQTQATQIILARLQNPGSTDVLNLPVDTISKSTVTQAPDYQLGRVDGKYIEVSLPKQTMYLIDGTNLVATFRVSTGEWSTPTPIGEFTIQDHIPVAWSAAFHLYMPHWMGLTGKSADGKDLGENVYGIHGLPYTKTWQETSAHIGTPVSHGCIRVGPGDIDQVYGWAEDGATKVFIHA